MKGKSFTRLTCFAVFWAFSLGGLSASANSTSAQKSRASRGPASVTQDPRVAAGFPDPLLAKGQLKTLPQQEPSKKSGNWSLLNLERASSLRSQAVYQPRSAASQTAVPAAGQANQVFLNSK